MRNNLKPKLIPAAIIIFWLIMTAALFCREVFSRRAVSAYRPFFFKDTLLSDQWMGIYFGNALAGFMHNSMEPAPLRKGVSGYRITSRTLLDFLFLQQRSKVWFDAAALLDADYELHRFNFELRSGAHHLRVNGEMAPGNKLNVTVDSQGAVRRKSISLPRRGGVIIAGMLSPFHSFGELTVGARYNLKVFNPFTLELEPLKIEVSARERIVHKGEERETFVIKSDYRGLEQIAWVDEQGQILREETPFGWVLVQEDADVAGRLYERVLKDRAELTEYVSLPSNVVLEREELNSLTVVLEGVPEGFFLESPRQKILEKDPQQGKYVLRVEKENIPREAVLEAPIEAYAELRRAEELIQADHPQIRAMARKITAKETDSRRIAEKINQWVFRHIRKIPAVSIPSAIAVLRTREGDCNEHTVLFVALARAAKIPAKINVGLVYNEGRFFYHAWPSVYVGQWLDMDPAFGQNTADPTHIKLIEGGLDKQLDIIRLLGKISLEVVEYK